VRISTNNDEGSPGITNDWIFGADGSLTFPLGDGIFDRSGIDTGFNIRSNNASSPIYLYAYGTDGNGTGAGNIYINPSSVEIYSNWQNGGAGEKKWTFGDDGNLTIPNGKKIQTTAGSGTSYIQMLTDGPGEINLTVAENSGNTQSTWSFFSVGQLELPEGGTITYTPATASDWAGTPPITIQEAIDRLAAAFKTANGAGA
jgi:hypothetical protein